jgi:hypothetical protein
VAHEGKINQIIIIRIVFIAVIIVKRHWPTLKKIFQLKNLWSSMEKEFIQRLRSISCIKNRKNDKIIIRMKEDLYA